MKDYSKMADFELEIEMENARMAYSALGGREQALKAARIYIELTLESNERYIAEMRATWSRTR